MKSFKDIKKEINEAKDNEREKAQARKKMQKALLDFSKSAKVLTSVWEDLEIAYDGKLDQTSELLVKEYPFKLSFDELTYLIDRWVKASVKELK